MHIGQIAKSYPEKAAYIIADSGEVVTYRNLDEATMKGTRLFCELGLSRGDHIALMIENHAVFLQICLAAERCGLYYTPISYQLRRDEVNYVLQDCAAKVFISSIEQKDLCAQLDLHGVEAAFMVDGVIDGFRSWEAALARMPARPISDESPGSPMLYSSGTTGRPKGILRPLPDHGVGELGEPNLLTLYSADETSVFFNAAPLYHSAPLFFCLGFIKSGGTVVLSGQFDAVTSLEAIQRYSVTHGLWVPTMFIRMLKLPADVRTSFDVSSQKVAIHGAAPCPITVKERMIEWWGPILNEYYAGTEGNGLTVIGSADWLQHRGSVGRAVLGVIHILNDGNEEVPAGEPGAVYFEGPAQFEYHGDREKTLGSRTCQGWSTLGDVGYVDEDGYLFLVDRKDFMIISGGVNIYPQEVENLLIGHPEVLDVAVIGVPNEEFGEEVKAVIQPRDMSAATDLLKAKLIAFCRSEISHIKCPRSIDFVKELPRHRTGKLLKRVLKDQYWGVD